VRHTRTRPLLSDVVKAELRRRIVAGDFPQGSKLPNEDQLCEMFDVSRVTLREAVRGLVEDGTVVRRHGSGTYVTTRPILHNSLETNFSYTEYFENSGIRTSKKLIDASEAKVEEKAAALLGIETNSPIVRITRLRLADGRPAIYSVDHMSTDIADADADAEVFLGSLYRLLASRGHAVEYGEALLLPVVADRQLAGILDVDKGTPLQYLQQVDYDRDDRAVLLSYEWHVPSVLELRVHRKGPGAALTGR
jgi:GntR family transcriptional regulator